jgi:hypothetical protein
MFEPRLNVLPPAQRRLWPELAATPPGFILYGGTAIALRLGHRESVDFDFFSFTDAATHALLSEVSYLRGAAILLSAPGTLTVRIGESQPVKVSFVGPLRLGQVDAPEQVAGPEIGVASLRDLGGVKVAVVTQRAEAKDCLDIHALIQAGVALPEMLAAAGVIYEDEFNPLVALKALAYHGDLSTADLSEGARRDLLSVIRSVDLGRLPAIRPYRRRRPR